MSASATQGGHKKLKPSLIASYDIRPGNGEGLFLFRLFVNLSLTYLGTYLLTYSPEIHTGRFSEVVNVKMTLSRRQKTTTEHNCYICRFK